MKLIAKMDCLLDLKEPSSDKSCEKLELKEKKREELSTVWDVPFFWQRGRLVTSGDPPPPSLLKVFALMMHILLLLMFHWPMHIRHLNLTSLE